MTEQSDTTNPQSKIQNLKLPQKVDLTEKNGMKVESHVMRDFHHFRRVLTQVRQNYG
jgi:hypothetical protein